MILQKKHLWCSADGNTDQCKGLAKDVRSRTFLEKVIHRVPCYQKIAICKILIIGLAIFSLIGSEAGVAFSQNIPDLFSGPVLPSDSDVGDKEYGVIQHALKDEKKKTNALRSAHVRMQREILKQEPILNLNLFPDAQWIFERDRVQQPSEESYTVHGKIRGEDTSDVMLVIEEDILVGHVRVEDKLFFIETLKEGLYRITEIDPDSLTPHAHPLIPSADSSSVSPRLSEKNSAMTKEEGKVVIDVMVLYTRKARIEAGGDKYIKALIKKAVEDTNQAFRNSFIDQKVKLVHTQEVEYKESGNSNTDLILLQAEKNKKNDPNGDLDQAHTLRDQFGADLVSLVVEDLDAGGIAYVMSENKIISESHAFSVVKRGDTGIGEYVLAHELGHNMGARHNQSDSAIGKPVFPYAYGYRDPNSAKQWRTIMAYPQTVVDPKTKKKVTNYRNLLPKFSNPSIDEGASPIGVKDHADNARTLNGTAWTVANFRQTKILEVVAPMGEIYNNNSGSQIGTVSFSWHAAPGANWYRLTVRKGFGGINDPQVFEQNFPAPNLGCEKGGICNVIPPIAHRPEDRFTWWVTAFFPTTTGSSNEQGSSTAMYKVLAPPAVFSPPGKSYVHDQTQFVAQSPKRAVSHTIWLGVKEGNSWKPLGSGYYTVENTFRLPADHKLQEGQIFDLWYYTNLGGARKVASQQRYTYTKKKILEPPQWSSVDDKTIFKGAHPKGTVKHTVWIGRKEGGRWVNLGKTNQPYMPVESQFRLPGGHQLQKGDSFELWYYTEFTDGHKKVDHQTYYYKKKWGLQ